MKDNSRDPLLMIILVWLAGQSATLAVVLSRLAVLEDRVGIQKPRIAVETPRPPHGEIWAMPQLLPIAPLVPSKEKP
jgi:hypothetical protein